MRRELVGLAVFSGVIVGAFWLALWAAGCTPSTLTPPPDATDAQPATEAGTTCAQACAALAAAGCSVGSQPTCPTFLQTAENSQEVALGGKALTCAAVLGVKTKADAQRLGFVCAP